EPVATVRARELDAELFEPVDRRWRFGRQHLDEARIRGVVRAAHDVLRVYRRRVVRAEGSLDAALRLRGVARLQGRLRGDGDPRPRLNGRRPGGEARGTAPDDEHVERRVAPHGPDRTAHPYICHYSGLFRVTRSTRVRGHESVTLPRSWE